MIEAFKAGIPGNGKPFPDGSKMAKIHWTARKAEDQPNAPVVPGPLHDVDFMVKDSKKFADSGGWGWAAFDYCHRVRDIQAQRHIVNATARARRQVRVRVPYDRCGKGLRFHGLPEAVKAPLPSA